MKSIFAFSFLLLTFALTSLPLAAENKTVAVLFHGTTETNRETFKFIRQQFNAAGLDYQLKATQNGSDISPNSTRAVIVINSGVDSVSAVDPLMANFVKTYPAKNQIILLTLVRNSHDATVHFSEAGNSSLGVDALAAASVWPAGFFSVNTNGLSKTQILTMHETWSHKIIDLLARM